MYVQTSVPLFFFLAFEIKVTIRIALEFTSFHTLTFPHYILNDCVHVFCLSKTMKC